MSKRHISSILFLALALAVFLSSQTDAWAMIYVCKDPRGGVSFTNVPSLPSCKVFSKKSKSGWSGSDRRKNHDSGKYDIDITRVSRRYNIDPHLIKAIIQAESDFNHRAVSKQGAQGLMQLMPATARELRVLNPFNPQENIDGGTRYFRRLMNTFGGNVKLSLAAYNAGPGQVLQAKGVPPIPETIRYVNKVLRQYRVYKTGR
jgi:soluble lytic murein transglycosylase-like protein